VAPVADQHKIVVSVKKAARKHSHKVANGANVTVLRADAKANKRAVNQSVAALVKAAHRHSLVAAALGRVSRLRKTLKPSKHLNLTTRRRIPYARRLKLAAFARQKIKKQAKKAAKKAAKAAAKK